MEGGSKMTREETILVLNSIENRAKDFSNMTACDWVAIAAAKRHLSDRLLSEVVMSIYLICT